MKVIFLAFMLIFTCAGVLPAQVIQYEIDADFNTGLTFNRGSVHDMLPHDNGDIFLTGMLNNIGSVAQAHSLINSNGDLISTMGTHGSVFNLRHYLGNYIHFGWTGITRFDFPGISVPEFRFEFSKTSYSGGGLSNSVRNALITENDHILVAGRFFTDSTLMGTAESHLGLRQLCMIDSTGAPVADFPMVHCAQPVTAEIMTIHQLSTGEYIIAGSFSEVNGHPYAKLAKLNPDFSVNTDFGHVFGTSGTGVFTTLIDSQDRIWVKFGQNIAIINQPEYSSRLVRVLSDGTLDSSFVAPTFSGYLGGTYENPGIPTETTANVTEDEDGHFIVHGQFTEINGSHYRRLAKITDSGEIIDGAFQSLGPDSAVWGSWSGLSGPVMDARISVIRKLPDGKLLLGGSFSSFGGEPYSCLVRLQPAGFVGTDDREIRGKLELWPNPSSQSVNIALPDHNTYIERIEICDLQGRTVHSLAMGHGHGHEIKISLQGLPSGIFVVRASTQQKRIYTAKLIINHHL